jgi:hypothetical protein
MAPKRDLVGKRYERLTVIRESGRYRKQVLWECRCDCGAVIHTTSNHLNRGNTKSCGCLKRELLGNRRRTHGLCRSPEYVSWCAMKHRCNNPENQDWEHYGGRGIKVCKRWEKSFRSFLADMGPQPPGQNTIERVNSDKDYKPSNCRWASQKEQTRNKRTTKRIEHNGETLTVGEWAERLGLSYSVLQSRIVRGWPIQLALTLSKQRRWSRRQKRT